MRKRYIDPDVYDVSESEECGYFVSKGMTYCRICGGGGLLDDDDRSVCDDCGGEGAFPAGDSDD